MSKPFDATLKELVEFAPVEWLHFLGMEGTESEIIDADLATVATDADRVFRVTTPEVFLAQVEFQASRDSEIVMRLLRYNVLLRVRYGIPVESALVLLRREADAPNITGHLSLPAAGVPSSVTAVPSLTFNYHVVRQWRISVGTLLEGGLATLPLAVVADVNRDRLPEVVRAMSERIKGEPDRDRQRKLWASAYIVSGLTYSADFADALFRGVIDMEESSTYQAILAKGMADGIAKGVAQGIIEGRTEEARRVVLRLGTLRFGVPASNIVTALETLSLQQLEVLTERLLQVESWSELLA